MTGGRSAWLVAAALLLVGRASAQDAPPPVPAPAAAPTPPLPPPIPPRLVIEERAKYPDGATGDAWVVLHIVVLEDGSVGEVSVIEGAEPFAAAAITAARASKFEPARRGDRTIRAKIRFAVRFVEPRAKEPDPDSVPPPSAPPASSGPPRGAPAKPGEEVFEEVVILGHRADPQTPTEHRMDRAEVRVIPGAFGDAFRAIDILPSVVPIVSGLPYYYVRGAPPSAVGYYVDEVRIPYLFHFALGPSVIQPALIDEVALHPAAFPARFGRFAGAILSGTTRDPAKEWYGEAQIRVFDAGAYVEAPFADQRGTAGVGGRYSYTAAILSLAAPDITIDYRDYNARVSYDLGNRWRATAFGFGAFDFASGKENGREQVVFASEFHRLDLRLDHRGEDGSVSRIAATIGLDRTRLEDARFAQNFMGGVRGRHSWHASPEVDLEIGGDLLAERYSGDVPNIYSVRREDYDQAYALFAPRVETATGAWIAAVYKPRPRLEITGTMRADLFTSDGKSALGPSPRLSMRVPLTRKLAFLGALGVAPQPPAFAIPVPAVGYRGLPGGLGYGYQKSLGGELALPAKFTFTAVGFHHSYFNLRDFSRDNGNPRLEEVQLEPSSPTQAYGLELFLKRKLSERYSAFASGTIARATLGSTISQAPRISPFDRTFVAQVGGIVDLGKNWAASSRFLTYGGWPVDAAQGGGRLRPFFRFDLRIEKRWVLRPHRWIGFVIEGLNVTASKEVLSRSCNNGNCKDQEFGPLIIPSLGVEGAL